MCPGVCVSGGVQGVYPGGVQGGVCFRGGVHTSSDPEAHSSGPKGTPPGPRGTPAGPRSRIVDRQTPVKTLHCHKLRLRAVIISI